MTKLIRYLNKHHNWLDYTQDNHLDISNLAIRATNKQAEPLPNCYEVSFTILKDGDIISAIRQNLCADFFKTLNSNDERVLEQIYQLLASFQKLEFSQKTFMTYLNNEESQLFKQEVGDPILFTQKNYYIEHQLILAEEELSQIESYLFKEDDF